MKIDLRFVIYHYVTYNENSVFSIRLQPFQLQLKSDVPLPHF